MSLLAHLLSLVECRYIRFDHIADSMHCAHSDMSPLSGLNRFKRELGQQETLFGVTTQTHMQCEWTATVTDHKNADVYVNDCVAPSLYLAP